MLKEISIMRPLLILLLVLFHSFIIYGGGWEEPVGFMEIPPYRNIAEWTYAFMLESFTFISGYVWLHVCDIKGTGSMISLIKNKTKRLLVPMLIFGLLYNICFMDYTSFTEVVYEVLNGAGHIWYLPMLFWCFVEAWILKHIKINEWIKITGLALLAIFCSELPIPFRIATSFYYLFFFYLPVLIVGSREAVYNKMKRCPFMKLTMAFIAAFLIIKYVAQFPHPIDNMPIVNKFALLSINNSMQMIYSALGVMAFYLTAVVLSGSMNLISKDTYLVKIGSYCFGVYIFQQFILKGLYFNTAIPEIVGPYWLPWVGVIAALMISFVLTYMIRLTKIGRAML